MTVPAETDVKQVVLEGLTGLLWAVYGPEISFADRTAPHGRSLPDGRRGAADPICPQTGPAPLLVH